jgi:hypothetical protein
MRDSKGRFTKGHKGFNPNKGKQLVTRIEVCCETCNRVFMVRPCRMRQGKVRFCSQKCLGKGASKWMSNRKLSKEQKEKLRKLKIGTKMKLKDKIHLSKVLRGSNGANWQGGLTQINKTIRGSFTYRQWRTAVFERDKYTCMFCGIAGGIYLHVDHIKPFALIIKQNQIKSYEDSLKCDELWDMNNARTLCVDCHKTTDTYLKPINTNL